MIDPRRPAFDRAREVMGSLAARDVALIHAALDGIGFAKAGEQAAHTLGDALAFFAGVRNVTGKLSQPQVKSINGILAQASKHPVGWVAYELATAWHEARFEPIPEIGRGKGRPYGQPGKYGQPQYGRGLVQLTWDRNFEWADRALGLDGELLKNFDLALDPAIAARILVLGMETGAFTGKKLADYISDRGTPSEWTDARRIVNGTDRAALIAGYAEKFRDALDGGKWA